MGGSDTAGRTYSGRSEHRIDVSGGSTKKSTKSQNCAGETNRLAPFPSHGLEYVQGIQIVRMWNTPVGTSSGPSWEKAARVETVMLLSSCLFCMDWVGHAGSISIPCMATAYSLPVDGMNAQWR